jgi:hypothetical protein
MADIDFVAGSKRTLQVAGINFDIVQIPMRTLPELARVTEPMMQELVFHGGIEPLAVLGLIGRWGEHAMDAVALMATVQGSGVGHPPPPLYAKTAREHIDSMNFEEFTALAMVCIEVNADFFTRALANLKVAAPKLAPSLLQKLLTRMPAATATTPAPSTSS